MVLTFVLFGRGDTGSAIRPGDVRVSAAGITVTLDHEKGKRVDGVARTITFPPGTIPGLEALLAKWEALRGATTAQSYFAFAHERRAAFPSTQIDTWLQLILGHLGERPPAGDRLGGSASATGDELGSEDGAS